MVPVEWSRQFFSDKRKDTDLRSQWKVTRATRHRVSHGSAVGVHCKPNVAATRLRTRKQSRARWSTLNQLFHWLFAALRYTRACYRVAKRVVPCSKPTDNKPCDYFAFKPQKNGNSFGRIVQGFLAFCTVARKNIRIFIEIFYEYITCEF